MVIVVQRQKSACRHGLEHTDTELENEPLKQGERKEGEEAAPYEVYSKRCSLSHCTYEPTGKTQDVSV